MTPNDQNRTFDRSLITRLMKGVRWMLEKDVGFAAVGPKVFVLEKGDIVEALNSILVTPLSVGITFDSFVPTGSSNEWVAKFSVSISEQYLLNRSKNDNRVSAQQLAEMVVAILHHERIEGDQDQWSELRATLLRFEGIDQPNNLLIWKADFQASTRLAAVNQEQI